MLGRCNGCTILNSFAIGTVTRPNSPASNDDRLGTGGFIGQLGDEAVMSSQAINVSNNYQQGDLLFSDVSAIGEFVGRGIFREAILNANYRVGFNGNLGQDSSAIGFVFEAANGGGIFASSIPNYYQYEGSEIIDSVAGENAFNTSEQVMRAATAPGSSPTDVYYRWSEENWDFGDAMQYPVLKYTAAADILDTPACRDAASVISGMMPRHDIAPADMRLINRTQDTIWLEVARRTPQPTKPAV